MRPTDDEYIRTDVLAKILGTSVQTIWNDISRIKERNRRIALGLPVMGSGPQLPPFYKFEKRVMFRRSEVDEWLLSRRVVKAPLPTRQQRETASA